VENGAQVARLNELDCDYAQGFFIGEPVTAKQVIEALGGLPYNVAQRRSGMAAFWDRLLGREERPAALPAPVLEPDDGPRVEDVADYEEDATVLQRRSPARAALPPPSSPTSAASQLPPAAPPLRPVAPPLPDPQPEPAEESAARTRAFGLASFTWRFAKPTASANDETPPASSAPEGDEEPADMDMGTVTETVEPQSDASEEEPREDAADGEHAEVDVQNSGAREKARRLRRRLRDAARSRSPAGE
jgi:hypothetical protein